jgi:hypothetical protein
MSDSKNNREEKKEIKNNEDSLISAEEKLNIARKTRQYSAISSYENTVLRLEFLTKVEEIIGRKLDLFKFGDYWSDYVKSQGFKGDPNNYENFALFLGVPEKNIGKRKKR